VLILTPALLLGQSASSGPDGFIDWLKKNATVLKQSEAGYADLRALKPMIGQARVVALGETHGTHELLALRNRLFQFLAQDMAFTGIAVESGVSETMEAEAFITGGAADPKRAARAMFSNNRRAYAENLDLIEWIRRYNTRIEPARRIHVYGIDMSGQLNGDFIESRMALDAALTYLTQVDSTVAGEFQARFDPFLMRFQETFGPPRMPDYRSLTSTERDTLTAAISDLVSVFERRRVEFIELTSVPAFAAGYRNAVAARQLDNHFRVRPEGRGAAPLDFREASTARDVAMAENVLWALEQGGPHSRLFVFAAMGHVRKSAPEQNDRQFFPGKAPVWMGEFLQSVLGRDLYVFGTAFRTADPRLNVTPPTPGSLEWALTKAGLPSFAVNLRAAPKANPVADWLSRNNTATAYDGFIVVDKIVPAVIVQ
jgi:erythromycin esterase